MSSLEIAGIASVCTFGSALIGIFLRANLPDHHLTQESKDAVKVVMALVASLAALVLGLLTASAKAEFDTQTSEVQQSAAKFIQLDRMLGRYGPEAKGVRVALRERLTHRLELTWPEETSDRTGAKPMLDSSENSTEAEALLDAIGALTPQNDTQRDAQLQAAQLGRDLLATRWLMLAQTSTPLPFPFLVVVVFWLSVLFGSFGLFAPRNPTVIVAFLLSVLAVSGALLLILEMSRPFTGLIRVSSAPMRYALSRIGN